MEEENKRKVKARFIIEMMGKPKKVVSKALKDVIKEIKKDGRGVEKTHYSTPKKSGKVLFSAFVEFIIICEDLEDLLGAVLEYFPINVEIIEPDILSINISALQDIVNDITSKLNDMDKKMKMLQATNVLLQRKMYRV